MKSHFCTTLALDMSNLTDTNLSLYLAQWLDAASRRGWDLVAIEPISQGTTAVIFSRDTAQAAAAQNPVPFNPPNNKPSGP